MDETNQSLLQVNLDALSENELRKLLTLYMTQQKLGLYSSPYTQLLASFNACIAIANCITH
jgi:hypothetical protein